jgi:hypothetical protein
VKLVTQVRKATQVRKVKLVTLDRKEFKVTQVRKV